MPPRKVSAYFDMDTRLGSIPLEWLSVCEHKIIRKGTCWLWQGGVDKYGEPIIQIVNLKTGKRTTKRLKVFVMEMFWEEIKGHEIIHSCGNVNCLNMKHMVIAIDTWRNRQRDRVIAEKSKRIKRYVTKEKS